MNNAAVLLPIFFPIVLAVCIWFLKFQEKKRNVFVSVGVIINLIFVIYNFYAIGESKIRLFKINDFLDIYFKIDKLSMLFSLLVSVLWVFATFYSMEYMKHEGKEDRFFTFFTLTLGVIMGISFSGNLVTLFIFYELLTLATFPLVIHSGTEEALNSGEKYLIYSFGGEVLVLLGMVLCFNITKNLEFVPGGVLSGFKNANTNLLLGIYVSMFIGFGVKSALVPFHSWMPEVMGAPTPVSAILDAVAIVKSSIFALIRMSYFIMGADVIKLTKGNIYMSVFIGVTIVMGSFLALHQKKLKRVLAYSTVSQLGYILLGIVIINENAFIGGLLHLINHAVIKITLFFCVGSIMYTTHKTEISEIKGIGRQMPITMWCFAISSISLIGIPPSNGFVSKWYLALGGLGGGKIYFVVILLVSAVLTSLYLMPIVTIALFKKGEEEFVERKEAPLKMLIPIVSITAIVVLLGIFPNPVVSFISEIAAELI